jgi:signal transduction histidine kinase
MTDEHRMSLTLADFPDPIIAYTNEDSVPRITAFNGAAASVFDTLSAGKPVATIFDQFTVVNSTGNEELVTHLVRGDAVGIYLDGFGEGGPFFARILAGDGDSGYLAFSHLNGYPDVATEPAIDSVSSAISHDLRNPLDVAKAHLRAGRETGDTDHFEAVAVAHDRMEQIIRDVLTITRDRTDLDPSDNVSIEAAATDAWGSVDTERATLDIKQTLPTATADTDRLQRLFENLFRNSVEHGSTGSRMESDDSVEHESTISRAGTDDVDKLGVDVDDESKKPEREPDSEPDVAVFVGALEDGFYVADDGPGIPPAEQAKVFEPGYSTRRDGTGLGLAIVDRIVASHGWELTLTTASNGGARFEIHF